MVTKDNIPREGGGSGGGFVGKLKPTKGFVIAVVVVAVIVVVSILSQ